MNLVTKIRWHVQLKLNAIILWLRGERGAARVLWRWMANLPTKADLVKARADLAARYPPGPPAPPDTRHLPRMWS